MTPWDAARWDRFILPTYGAPAIELVAGHGCLVTGADGTGYLDLVAGIACNTLGHAHPAVVDAIRTQAATLGQVSNLYGHPGVLELAERIDLLVGGNTKTFFANSGTEANEAALKLVRKRFGTTRPVIVCLEHSFHGRSMGPLSVTDKAAITDPFRPLPYECRVVPFGDRAALASAIDSSVAAVICEPIQGESGVHPLPDGYLSYARELARAAGAMLILDEVQTGVGRTGDWFAFQHEGIRPDIMTLAKGLGGGMPIGACVAFDEAAEVFTPGDHGSTFGGNPISCAAALAVLSTVEHKNLVSHARELGGVASFALANVSGVSEVRGRGLMIGIDLQAPVAKETVEVAASRGFLINATGPQTLRLVPALVITDEQLGSFVAALPGIIEQAQQ